MRLKQWLEAAEKEEFDEDHPDDEKAEAAGVPLRRSNRRK